MPAWAKEIPNTSTAEDNVIVLDKETIKGFGKGILVGTLLRLDKKSHLADVEIEFPSETGTNKHGI